LLLISYVAVFCRVKRGTNYKKLLQLSGLLLLSNIGTLMIVAAQKGIINCLGALAAGDECNSIEVWCWLQGISQFITDATFLTSHWMFAFEYFKIGRRMPFVVEEKQIPENMISNQDRVDVIVLVLNVLVPFLEASSGTWYTLQVFGGNPSPSVALKVTLDINTYLVGTLEIVSGLCLFYAVFYINKYVTDQGSSIDKRALILHATSFGLYLVGVIVMDGYYFNY